MLGRFLILLLALVLAVAAAPLPSPAKVYGNTGRPRVGRDAAKVYGNTGRPRVGRDAAKVYGNTGRPRVGRDAAKVYGNTGRPRVGRDASEILNERTNVSGRSNSFNAVANQSRIPVQLRALVRRTSSHHEHETECWRRPQPKYFQLFSLILKYRRATLVDRNIRNYTPSLLGWCIELFVLWIRICPCLLSFKESTAGCFLSSLPLHL